MTTLTPLLSSSSCPPHRPPSISLSPTHTLARVNPHIYGGFVEHMGRCVYGGLYDPSSSASVSDPATGFRTDVLGALRDELGVPVVRWPGGNFVAGYHWEDGVGPRERRPRRRELAWIGTESNEFGTDEFMAWCEQARTEPYLALNMGTGTLDEALGWVEYCNLDTDTHYASMRRRNGRDKPYNVKFWALGNETWGPWQVEQLTAGAYAAKAYQWAKALKRLDPTITLILCGKEGFTSWDALVTKECIKPEHYMPLPAPPAPGTPVDASVNVKCLIDMVSIHLYTSSPTHAANALAPLAAEHAIQSATTLIQLARIENNVPPHLPTPKICFDEWNVWSPTLAPGEHGAEQEYTLSDALAVAVWLNVFVRQARHVGMANLAQSVNVISPLRTTPHGIVRLPTWWPLVLFSKYMRNGQSVAVHVASEVYEGETTPQWLRGTRDTPWLDVSCVAGDDGWVSLAVVNAHEERDFVVDINAGIRDGAEVDVYEVNARGEKGVGATAEDVGVAERKWTAGGGGGFEFARHSLTMLRWKV